MLTRRVIPCLDVDRGRVIRGVRFSADKVVGDRCDHALGATEQRDIVTIWLAQEDEIRLDDAMGAGAMSAHGAG